MWLVGAKKTTNLPGPENLTAADFDLRVGNNNDLSTWAAAPEPESVTVRPEAGVDSSDRVTILWPDQAIMNRGLRVEVLASAATNLAAFDVHFWGNAVGETSNDPLETYVDTTDNVATLNNLHHFFQPATVEDAYDFNRDRMVVDTDLVIIRDHGTDVMPILEFIDAPLSPTANRSVSVTDSASSRAANAAAAVS